MSQLLQIATRAGDLPALNGTTPPDFVDQGIPYVTSGEVAIDTVGAVDHWHQGIPYTAQGRIAASVGNPTDTSSGAAPMDGGRLSIRVDTIDRVEVGVPFGASSNLAQK